MTQPRDPETLLATYLADGMTVLPDRVTKAVMDEVHRTRQRTVLRQWRTRSVSRTTLAAAVVVAMLVLGAALLVAGGGPGPAPVSSPEARVDASAPANSIEAPPSSGDPAPSASASPQPTPTPDAEEVRTAAAAQYLTAAQATTQAFEALTAVDKEYYRGAADIWGQFAADLEELQVPADTAADLHDLIRKVKKVQALFIEQSGHFASMDDFYTVARHLRNARSRASAAVDRVRADLDLPALCHAGCSEPPPIG